MMVRVTAELASTPTVDMCMPRYDDHILSINCELPSKLIFEIVDLTRKEARWLAEDYLLEHKINFHNVEGA